MATVSASARLSRSGMGRGSDAVPGPAEPGRTQRRAMSRDPLDYLCHCADELGDTVRLDLDRPAYLLNDPTDIRQILAVNPLNYDKEHTAVRWFRGIFGRSLPFLEGEEHRQHRRAMQSSFRPRALHHVPARLAAHLDELAERWPADGAPTDVAGAIRGVTIAAAARLILGIDRTEAAEHLFRAIQKVHRRTVARMGRPVAWPGRWPRWVPSRRRRQHRRAVRELDAAVLELIRHRRAGRLDGEDALSNVLRMQADGSMPIPDTEVRDHCVNLLLAATDPIAYGICWALHFLAECPEAESEVIAESRRVLDTGPPGMEQLQRLDVARRTFLEALRLRPSTWLLERQPLETETLPSGVTLPAGCRVMISPYVLHRRPALHPEPDRFDPARFTAEAERQRSPYAYLPFGAGPRVCIGQHMATFIGTLTLAHLLPRFRFEPAFDQPLRYGTLNGFTIQPEGGVMMMRVARRG